jgi:CubicO group peptidase (beta-lactamase class C family)
MKRLLALVALAACSSPGKTPDPPSQPSVPAVQARVEQAILPAVVVRGEDVHYTLAERMAKHRVPGVSIAVFDDYRLVWAKAYGVADTETGAPVTETTLFQAGSISKSVNALAVMTAVADGKLDLDTPINTYLATWKLPDNDLTKASPVTLRKLLSHTAGTTVHGFPGYAASLPVPTIVQVLDGAPPANTPAVRVDLAPGTEFRYSGGGTTISQLALVDVLGAPYPQITRDRVLGPLGMTASTYEQPLPPDKLATAAAGHHRDGSPVPGKRHTYPEMAAAGLWTTPTDLAKFFLELSLARAGKSSLVPQDTATLMTTVVAKNGPMPTGGVGLGVFIMDRNGALTFGHGGADEGFQADAVTGLDGGFGVVVMANSDNGFALFPEIERTVFAAMGWPGADTPIDRVALTPEQRQRFVGTFVNTRGLPISIVATGERLERVRPLFDERVELVPVAADKLAATDQPITYTSTTDGLAVAHDGRVMGAAARLAPDARLPLVELAAGRFDDAVAAWKALRARDPAAPTASEDVHNLYGYELLQDGRVEQSILVFRAIVAVYPESSNAYDSYGEALMVAGKKAEAIAAYETSLAKLDADQNLDADSKPARRKHGEQQLAKLRAMK